MRLVIIIVMLSSWLSLISCNNHHKSSHYFVVKVIDKETGRGVPLVELKLPNEVKYWTDSAGIVAFDEPSYFGSEVFITVRSHGYEFEQKIHDEKGLFVKIEAGKTLELKIKRTMIAERLYRLTGEGIYRDSNLAKLPTPIKQSQLKGKVLGQDTVSSAIYKDKIFWIWGDTIGPDYWNFNVSAATSDLKQNPKVGIVYNYFTDKQGRAKPMLPLPREGLVWIEGLVVINDPNGEERLIATYTRQDGLKFPDECGLALFDDALEIFKQWIQLPCERSHYSSHPFLHHNYWYFYPSLRVPNDWNAIQEISKWEHREVNWSPNSKRPSSMVWNDYRQRWILLSEDSGNVYYAEARNPEGPFGKAVKIIHHDNYSFYNVTTHAFFNQDGGRIIYLEGTYSDTFSNAKEKTPRYNYNQIMYRLLLDNKLLEEAQK